MQGKFYRQRKNKYFFGVLAGLSDKFGWDVNLVRILFIVFSLVTKLGALFYLLGILLLPYKEDLLAESYGHGPRKRKEAEVIKDKPWFW